MKKLLGILLITVWAFAAFSQTSPTEVTPDSYVTNASYTYLWGTTADTLTNADTLEFVFRVRGTNEMDFKIGLYSDHVSGTAGGTLIGYGSFDGVNYFSLGDTITVSSLSADAFDAETLDYTDYLWPYMKFIYLQTGTAITVPYAYVYSKYN